VIVINILRNKPLNKILFIDIETAPEWTDWRKMPEAWFECWWDRVKWKLPKDATTPEDVNKFRDEQWKNIAGMPEFSKVVCVAAGMLDKVGEETRIKIFVHKNEELVLNAFATMLSDYSGRCQILCAHNGKGFDYTFLSSRMMVHGIPIPEQLDIIGKKPWEILHLDTQELWPGSRYVSMRTLSLAFGLPDPKDICSGADVPGMIAKGEYKLVGQYCNGDVTALINLFLAMRGDRPLIECPVMEEGENRHKEVPV